MLNIGSLNVRGIGDRYKRVNVFNMVNLEGFDVVFLMETHCSNIKEGKQWSFGYLGKCFWSWGKIIHVKLVFC